MDIESVVGQVRAVVVGQLVLAGDAPSIITAGEAILAALEPALHQAGTALAEQAAVEVAAQLPDHTVDVVLSGGQPNLVVRSVSETIAINTEHLDARITVRLPEELKGDLEEAASDIGDSVNTFVIRALAGRTKARRHSSRSTFEGTIET